MKVTMDVGAEGVALITISNPPVNSLSNPILTALMQKYNEANTRDDVKSIVIIGEGGKFSAGFDISVFTEVQKNGDLSLLGDVAIDLMVNRIEVSLLQACHARIATPKAQLGLPELSLGVIPGFGGTQMLPRLVGVSKAIDMMLSSKPITSEEGKERGLIDAIVPPNELLKAARLWALDIANRRKPWMSSLRRTDRIGSFSEARDIINAARQHAKQTAKNLPHHQGCLDVIEEGVIFGGHAGLLREAKVFKELVLSDTSKGLVHVFFAQRATAKIPGVTDVGLKPRKMQKVAVIGGGLMGSGIATALIVSGVHVILKEIHADFLKQGINRIADNLQGHVRKGIVPKAKLHEIMSLVKGVLDYSEFKNVDMVIEAVIEKVPLKQSIFNDLEKACPSHCILATNTSTIDLNVVGARTHFQDRIIGAHFFSPAHVMPLLEIVHTKKTSPQTILDLMTLGKAIKKVPVVVGNCTGFAVNRTFFPYSAGAHLLANLGVDVFRIDRAINSFGMPMGPFQLQDLAGYDVALAVAVEFSAAFSDRRFNSPLVKPMVESGRYGKKNGRGYYLYEKGSKPKPDPEVLPILEECRRRTNVMPVVNEACRVLDDGVVVRASDLDIASVLGMSFPSYRGGIVFWADTVGAGYICSRLKKWAETYGPFYKPSAFLEQRAAKGLPLSSPSAAGKSVARI